MTRQEMGQILYSIKEIYPRFGAGKDAETLLDIWSSFFKADDYIEVDRALRCFISVDEAGFPPTIGGIRRCMTLLARGMEVESAEGQWDIVMKSIQSGIYGSEEGFRQLDSISQTVLGTPASIRRMALNESFNEGVEKSLFIKEYRLQQERMEEVRKLPVDLQKKLPGIERLFLPPSPEVSSGPLAIESKLAEHETMEKDELSGREIFIRACQEAGILNPQRGMRQ